MFFAPHMLRKDSPTNCGELGPHVDDHDGGHDQCNDVREVGRALENDCVGQLDGARVALGWNASVTADA